MPMPTIAIAVADALSESTVREVVAGALIALGSMYRGRRFGDGLEAVRKEVAKLRRELIDHIEVSATHHKKEN